MRCIKVCVCVHTDDFRCADKAHAEKAELNSIHRLRRELADLSTHSAQLQNEVV